MLRAPILSTFMLIAAVAGAAAADSDLIYKKSTVWKLIGPDHKLAVYGLDDPLVDGVACHYAVPETGGVKGMLGLAEELSQASLSCRQTGPIAFKEKFEQGEEMFSKRRSLFFKRVQIVRGCDARRNVLVYLIYTDKLIEGSPENSVSTVPIMPWGAQTEAPKCADWTTG